MRTLTNKELYSIWKRLIDKNLYRVISEEYLKDVLKNGFNPKKDPFSNDIKKKIRRLLKIIIKLQRKRIVYVQFIGKNNDLPITGEDIAMRSMISMDSKFIDLTPNYLQALKFNRKWRGGALTQTVRDCCEFLENKEEQLNESEKELIKELYVWSLKKGSYPNRLLFIRGSHRCLEKAKFHYQGAIHSHTTYWESPYGSFEYFKRLSKKCNIMRYVPYLKNEKYSYLRVVSKIPPSAIEKVR